MPLRLLRDSGPAEMVYPPQSRRTIVRKTLPTVNDQMVDNPVSVRVFRQEEGVSMSGIGAQRSSLVMARELQGWPAAARHQCASERVANVDRLLNPGAPFGADVETRDLGPAGWVTGDAAE